MSIPSSPIFSRSYLSRVLLRKLDRAPTVRKNKAVPGAGVQLELPPYQKSGSRWKAAKRQKGFTALELIVVLIVGMGIIGLAASKMDLLFGKANVFEEISNLNLLLANLKNLKTTSGYGLEQTDLIPQLISTKGVPQNMSVVGGGLYNLWGGTVAITSTGIGFSIRYTKVPQEACIKLATQANRGGAFASVTVNGGAAVEGEYSSARATADCSSSTANMLSWTTNT